MYTCQDNLLNTLPSTLTECILTMIPEMASWLLMQFWNPNSFNNISNSRCSCNGDAATWDFFENWPSQCDRPCFPPNFCLVLPLQFALRGRWIYALVYVLMGMPVGHAWSDVHSCHTCEPECRFPIKLNGFDAFPLVATNYQIDIY